MWTLIMGAVQSSSSEPADMEPLSERIKKGENLESSLASTHNSSGMQRQQGDGMEIPCEPVKSTEEVRPTASPLSLTAVPSDGKKSLAKLDSMAKGASDAPSKSAIYLPDTGLTLAKLPPICDKVDLAPKTPDPSVLCQERPVVYPKGTLPPAVKKAREPKFVPYEPYKGAVKAFVVDKRSSTSRRSPEKKISNAKLDRNHSVDTVEQARGAEAAEAEEESPLGAMNPQLEENYRVMLSAKEKEIEQLKRALENAEKQLKIQTQVNSEVKKLLVASVGEDIEARVDFLTQDKARLAADVIQYNNKISRDWEEKEALSVESDVWRSKFLASTLIVEEVTRGKQLYVNRCDELEHTARRLLVERGVLRTHIAETQHNINSLLTAFDPLSVVDREKVETGDVIQLTQGLSRTSANLCVRMLGENRSSQLATASQEAGGSLAKLHQVDTQAERELKRLLQKQAGRTDGAGVPEEASSSLSKGARLLLMKMGDKAQSPSAKADFKTCSHCHGSVHVV